MLTSIRSDRATRGLASSCLVLALSLASTTARADEPEPAPSEATPPDPLDALRGRFREGM